MKFLKRLPKTLQLLDHVRDVCRYKHYSIRTEQAYVDWIKRYIYFYGLRKGSVRSIVPLLVLRSTAAQCSR